MDTSSFKILAVETSCDETAASVIEAVRPPTSDLRKTAEVRSRMAEVRILSNVVSSQIDIHRKFGGVFPEHASRAHAEKIIPVVEKALGNVKPDAVAVTIGPGLIGSLLVGVNFAKTYAFANNLPMLRINHLLGHIYSCFANPSSPPLLKGRQGGVIPQFPALILIVSGGHTGLVLMKSHTDIKTLGETLDDAAGEAFDKVAKLLGLGYPGGPAIAAEAAKCHPELVEGSPAHAGSRTSREILHCVQDDKLKLPRPMLNSGDFNFSFSGLKTAVLYKVKELTKTYNLKPETFSAALAAEFQQAVIDILIGKTIQAAYDFRPKSICLCGGVSANKELREQLKKAVSGLPWHPLYHIPHPSLTTDNAAMIGVAAGYHLDKITTYDKISANANLKL